MIYVGHDEQFHFFHSVQHTSVTMQTSVLEVQQYFKTHYLQCFGPYCSIISEYKKLYKNITQYIGLLYVELLEIFWCTICIVDQIVYSTL